MASHFTIRPPSNVTVPSSPFQSSTNTTETILTNSAGAISGALILSMVFILGIPGNLFVIWSIMARARHRSVTMLLILNLACADGFLMVLTPFFIVYLLKQSWDFGLATCKVIFYLCCANMYASIFLITLMSLHRLVAIVWPRHLRSLSTRRTIRRAMLLIWFLALALAVPVLVFRNVNTREVNTNQTGGGGLVCQCTHPEPYYVVMQYAMETLLSFLLPYGIILGSYICILRKIQKTKFKRRIRSEKLILAIVITFGLFWLPYHIINIVQIAETLSKEETAFKKRLRHMWTSMRALTSTVAFISSCVNPILYTLVGKAYIRQAGVAFMARLFEAAGIDPTSRKTGRCSQNSREKEETQQLPNKETDSTSVNTSSNVKVTPDTNGKSFI
ncbi:leukotriene B4 receptor 2a [Hoplias malabaricus]|uniref:leukotriene B4 receptor 2a n=1 Tax=Hoplias malabaricus TaxID=27720 RepID=UPI0034628294